MHADAVIPAAAAGLSLGEYTALWLAGSMTFADGLRLVRSRGRFMQDAAESRRGGMVSVQGLDESQVATVTERAAAAQTLVAANFNAPGQIVVSGDVDACDRATAVIEELGGGAITLQVAGAFHSPLMESAAIRLAEVLAQTGIKPPGIPVVSNVTADYYPAVGQTADLLCRQVTHSVRWHMSIDRLIRDGFDRFVEVGPGRVLTGLMRRIDRSVRAMNLSSAAALEKMASELATGTAG
jgi:[acyl-carrier-protein] S-malonyltransferase